MAKKKSQKKTWGKKTSAKANPDRRVPRNNGTKKSPKSNYELTRWITIICLSLILSVLLFPNLLSKPKKYKTGDIADRDIKASHEFLLEDIATTEKNRQRAVRECPPVYDFDPTGNNTIARVREAFAEARNLLASSQPRAEDQAEPPESGRLADDSPGSLEALKETFFATLDIPPDNDAFEVLLKAGFPPEAERSIQKLISPVLKQGIVGNKESLFSHTGTGIIIQNIFTDKEQKATDLSRFLDLEEAKAFVKKNIDNLKTPFLPPQLKEAVLRLSTALLKPNLTFNKRETEIRKDAARKAVKPVYYKVKKGEMIVREGELISQEHLLKLSEEYRHLNENRFLGYIPAMAILIGFLFFSFYLVGVDIEKSRKHSKRDLFFHATIFLIFFLLVMASNLVASQVARGFPFFTARALLFAIPVATGAMLISLFQGIRVAMAFSVVISVLASLVLGRQVEFFVYFFVGSLIAAYGMKECRERGTFIKTGLQLSFTNVILALAIEVLCGCFYSIDALVSCASAFVGGVLAAVIATGSVPLIEMAFGYTTDIKLLELASLDQPLLKELMVQAPGTYHHSVIVSQMVEASAEAVNANPLLAKVAAYYHDIGKMKKPLYFIENQVNGQNKHEKLAPSMSSLILISHVKDGVELAKKYKLGREIIDIIQQHHGTSLITYFYEKAKEQAEQKSDKSTKVKEEDFRYPGPKPQTKEAGLVMLADAVQAASKTLVEPTPARIQGLVQRIINRVFSDGQLDECELTLKDLHQIAKSFNKTLSGIFHQRIEYPEPAIKTSSPRKGTNGNTDHMSSGEFRDQKTANKGKDGESLKRLGLS